MRILTATTSLLYLPFQICATGEMHWGQSPCFSTPTSLYDAGTVRWRPHNLRSSIILFDLDLEFPSASSWDGSSMIRAGRREVVDYVTSAISLMRFSAASNVNSAIPGTQVRGQVRGGMLY